MDELGDDVVRSARERIGAPFEHHFKPTDLCDGGKRTIDECMEHGMGIKGYDCSGLAITSLCEVLGVPTNEWPREMRHAQQLARLATRALARPGDFELYFSAKGSIHIGIVTSADEVIHASGLTKVVEESVGSDIAGSFEAIKVVTLQKLLSALDTRVGGCENDSYRGSF